VRGRNGSAPVTLSKRRDASPRGRPGARPNQNIPANRTCRTGRPNVQTGPRRSCPGIGGLSPIAPEPPHWGQTPVGSPPSDGRSRLGEPGGGDGPCEKGSTSARNAACFTTAQWLAHLGGRCGAGEAGAAIPLEHAAGGTRSRTDLSLRRARHRGIPARPRESKPMSNTRGPRPCK
jgi:hypothetical protein